MSESNGHQGLAAALAAFQAEAPTFIKANTAQAGSFSYKYADLGDILPVVNPLLAKHGLSWSSKPSREDGEPVLRYRLLHTSGEVDGDMMPLGVPKNCKPQELGSAITYARRYALTAQLNLATDEDDDGQAAQQAERQAPQPTARAAEQTTRPASAKQRGMILGKAADKKMSSSVLANVILVAVGQEPRDWDSQEHAQAWLARQLDRLPASAVDSIVAGIEADQ